MPTPRGQPTRSSQRRNSLQDDTPVRTRAGRGGKSAPFKPEEPDFAPQKSSPTKLSPTTTRKTTRSASNISGRSFEAAPEVYASYEEPLLMVFGLPPSFFDRMKKHHGKLPKERKSLNSSLTRAGDTSDDEQDSELEEKTADESEEESEVEEPPVSQVTPRGRGRGRGGRGGRGRGGRGRGRGRGGRPRGGAARAVSPVRARMSRNVAPMNPLTEEEDDDSANQGSRTHRAKPSSGSNDEPMGEAVDSDDDNDNAIADDESDEDEEIQIVQKASATPGSSPPDGLQDSVLGGTYVPSAASQPDYGPSNKNSRSSKASKALSVPKVQLLSKSATQTPRNATPAEFAVPALLNPEDDVLSDSDLPEPWIEGAPVPLEADCEDRADFLLQKRFKPMVDVQEVIASLTKFAVSQRSTESLYALAENTQNILKHWQDQYLMLDARTAPHMHPAKKACNGGRIPIATDVFEAMKEADLYGYNYDPKKNPEAQDPWGQRPGAEKSGGRELRTRRNRDMLDSAPASEDEDEEDGEGRPAKRQRRATRKFDGSDAGTGTNTPKKHNGWGGARKKGVSRFSKNASETPEPESRPTKRARTAASNLLHQRIQEMREASLVSTGSGDEESSAMEVDDYSDTNVKRGRPAGSKNVARRSDYGVKKGPRKKPGEASAPAPSAHGPNAPPPALQSMSEGQATPHPSASQEMAASQPEMADAYMSTAPLSQYTNNYAEETSPASGSRRKPRVKSEKRSQSMTIWWAERKARKKEQDEKHGTPLKEESRPGSSNERRGGRASTGSAAAASSTTPAEPPRPPQYGARALAPAPLHQQPPSYPAPYGAQSPTSSRPQSSGQLLRNGPPPLAPAPLPHFSPYAPVPLGRERAFQVMVPGPPPGERRGSG
ncbi:hypothetical protein HBH56_122660 [Parastagonospora nodorum]|nr:hypothetical protein HBH56_122660 [Parastagonospora nodorum]KAH3935203.1 hypothetical protein HBH54_048210 [Parastagonospora nodorum]KAH4060827.1 hypothetical protein HBH49_007180 [Parastagonospora nodorum]KAH4073474.1 hypothetical protein HBH50_054580 [Parastagonospora nodorum]KAH4170411.1 hypothetical protein HBH44_038620 [Parastagonospora nodorum]